MAITRQRIHSYPLDCNYLVQNLCLDKKGNRAGNAFNLKYHVPEVKEDNVSKYASLHCINPIAPYFVESDSSSNAPSDAVVLPNGIFIDETEDATFISNIIFNEKRSVREKLNPKVLAVLKDSRDALQILVLDKDQHTLHCYDLSSVQFGRSPGDKGLFVKPCVPLFSYTATKPIYSIAAFMDLKDSLIAIAFQDGEVLSGEISNNKFYLNVNVDHDCKNKNSINLYSANNGNLFLYDGSTFHQFIISLHKNELIHMMQPEILSSIKISANGNYFSAIRGQYPNHLFVLKIDRENKFKFLTHIKFDQQIVDACISHRGKLIYTVKNDFGLRQHIHADNIEVLFSQSHPCINVPRQRISFLEKIGCCKLEEDENNENMTSFKLK